MSTPEEKYPLAPESFRHDGVPVGQITKHTWTSRVFPGTVRDYWVYVPAQYSADKPACVMVFQDGGGYSNVESRMRIPVVFDNLIHQKDIPVIIGIFINPGFVPPVEEGASGRPNRSFEYDAVSGRYVQFLEEEIIPEVRKDYNLSSDPNDYGISGGSSGGICAFTAAWFRPDVFRRVLSFVGSFTNLRGGDVYPALIRKTEVKPIRVFIQSGENDMNIFAGSWYRANQHMASSFEYMGYDYKVVIGDQGHDDIQGASVLPDALRWLWRDHPRPIERPVAPASRQWATEIVSVDSKWEQIGDAGSQVLHVAADALGNVYTASDSGQIDRLPSNGRRACFAKVSGPVHGLAIAPDGQIFAALEDEIVAFDSNCASKTVVSICTPAGLVVSAKGSVYFTDRCNPYVWQSDPKGHTRIVHKGIASPTGLRFSANESLLTVADSKGRWGWSFQVQPDGSLANEEAFHRLEISDETSVIGASSVLVDTTGCFYIATSIGIQVCDQEGRVSFIIDNPPGGATTSISFGGDEGNILYAAAGGRLYSRPVLRKGVV